MKIHLEADDIDEAVREWIAARNPSVKCARAAEWGWEEAGPGSVSVPVEFEGHDSEGGKAEG